MNSRNILRSRVTLLSCVAMLSRCISNLCMRCTAAELWENDVIVFQHCSVISFDHILNRLQLYRAKNNQSIRSRQLQVVRANVSIKLSICQLSERLSVSSCQCVKIRKRRLDEFREHFATSAFFLRLLCETQKHTTISLFGSLASSESVLSQVLHRADISSQYDCVSYIVSHDSQVSHWTSQFFKLCIEQIVHSTLFDFRSTVKQILRI